MCAAPVLPLVACRGNPSTAVGAGAAPAAIVSRPTDIRIVAVDHQFEEFRYRAPYQFGGRIGRSGHDPQRQLPRPHAAMAGRRVGVRLDDARKRLGVSGSVAGRRPWRDEGARRRAAPLTAACDERGHPIDLFRALEPEYLRAAAALSARAQRCRRRSRSCARSSSPARSTPRSTTPTARRSGVSCYETYGPSFMSRDLSHDLGAAFKGEYLDRYVPSAPRATTPVFHSVGASDPLEAADVRARGSTMGCRTRSRSGFRATA